MTGLALGLVLSAAVLHATWNLLAKRSGGGWSFLWLVCALTSLIYAPVAAWSLLVQRPHLGPIHLAFIFGSGVLHLAYFVALTQGYRMGDLSLVYPLARGTGPALSAAAAIAFLRERPTALAIAGAAFIVGGAFVLTSQIGAPGGSSRRIRWAVIYGVTTGAIIASYTLWDKWAVSTLLIPPLLLEWGSNFSRLLLLTPMVVSRWPEIGLRWRAHRLETTGVAVLAPLAYILVLTALVFTPVSYVAPAREVSILIGTIMGTRLLAEADDGRRFGAAAAIVVGVVALALG